MLRLTEVVHIRLLLEEMLASLLSESHEVGCDRLFHRENSGIGLVLQTPWLGLPNDSSFSTLGGLQLQLVTGVGVKTLQHWQLLGRGQALENSNSGDLERVPLHPKLKLDFSLRCLWVHDRLEDVVFRILDDLNSPVNVLDSIESADEKAEGISNDGTTCNCQWHFQDTYYGRMLWLTCCSL